MAVRYYNNVGYSLNQSPLTNMAPYPIIAKRAPIASDTGFPIGQLWVFSTSNLAYILTSVLSGVATWQLIETSGGAGVFASLTVTPGPISLTGTTSINIAGAGVTTINTGGTGALNLGNATGNTAVTGSLSTTTTLNAAGIISAGTGLAVTAGGLIYIKVGTGAASPEILAGSGVPTLVANQGSLYLRTDGSSTTTRMYVAVDSAGTWTNLITTA